MNPTNCYAYEQVIGIAWWKPEVEAGWLVSGMTNTRKTAKVFNHNHQLTIKTNLSMSNYLDQLREEVRLKRLGVKEPKKQKQSGLLSLLDLIDTNPTDAKK